MKHCLALSIALLAAGPVSAADVSPTNQVADAITKLKDATNYSWTTTTVMVDMPFTPGPIKGQADKEGFSMISQEFGENTTQVVLKGDKVAAKMEDGWELLGGEDGGFPAMMAGGLARNGTAAHEAEIILKQVKDLKPMEGEALGGDLTADGATDLLTFGPRRAANAEGGFPPPKNAKGSAKFWIKDGMLTKYESHLHGTVTFQDEMEMDTTRTVEIQNVGTTKMEIPDDAKKKLEAKGDAKPEAK